MSIDEYYQNQESYTVDGLTPEEQIEDLDISKKPSIGKHFLDTDKKTRKYFRMIRAWWRYERIRQASSRQNQIRAHNYRDNDQWSDEDANEVEKRGQQAQVFNLIKPGCDWLVGTEKRMKVDYEILPRRKNESKQAEIKTKLLKYLSDTCKISFARSLAFEDAIISGVGWLNHGVRSDADKEPLYVQYVDWRNVWYDSHAKERDMSDGRYQFLSKIVDYDIAVAMFPDRADCIRASLNQTDSTIDEYNEYNINPEEDDLGYMGNALETDTRRDRVRLVSCEYRIPTAVKVIHGKEELGTLNGQIYDPEDIDMQYLVDNGHASLNDAVRLVMWKMIFCGNYVLQNRKRIYSHDQFSMIPMWGYKKKIDNTPYGIVEQQIDPQDDFNKRRSKALFILSTKQSIIHKNAVDDMSTFVEERDRPDGNMVVNDMAGVELITDRTLAEEHIMLMDRDEKLIESAGGVTKESRGIETNAISGIAIKSREEKSHVASAELFDNYRYTFQVSGEVQLSLIEQFYTDKKTVRLTGEKGGPDFIDINSIDEFGDVENDITSTQADFVVSADNYHASVRQALFESFGELMTRMQPEVAMKLLDLWVDLSDIPGREVMVQRIRDINGQNNPDEDPNDPEVQERNAAAQEEAQKQKDIEDRLISLELALKESEIKENEAKAEKSLADAEAKLAKIATDSESVKIKKAELLNKMEVEERKPLTTNKENIPTKAENKSL